jgi:hypothetical protein
MLKELKKDVLLKNQKGATLVEFAIILPLLLLLIFGIIEFGLFLFNRHVITNAVREAARAGIVVRNPRLLDEKIEDIVENYCKQYLVTFGEGTLKIPSSFLREDKDGISLADGEGAFGGGQLDVLQFHTRQLHPDGYLPFILVDVDGRY